MISNQDRANHYKIEYDARNPRLRMNILGFLLSEGEAPNAEDADEFLDMVNKMVHFITNDVEPFAGLVQSLEDEEGDDSKLPMIGLDDDDDGGSPYL